MESMELGQLEQTGQRSTESVLVVDQSPNFAEALTRLLSREGMRAAHASFADAPETARALQPTLLLVDADEPWQHILACAHDVRAVAPASRILLVVGEDRGWSDALAEQAGALGCVSRNEGGAALLAAISQTRSGRPRRGGAKRASHRLRPVDNRWAGPLALLTQREREILEALAGARRDPAIALDLGISSHTVRTHVQHILAKLGVHTRHQAVTVALRAGLRPS